MGYVDEKGAKKIRDDYVARVAAVDGKLANYTPTADLDSKIDEKLGTYLDESELTEKLEGYVQDSQLNTKLNDYVSKAGLKEEVATAVGTVFVYKGSVDNKAALTELEESAQAGDVYNVSDTKMNFIRTAEGTWDEFAPEVDLSSYVTNEQLSTKLSGYITSEALEAKKYVDETELAGKGYIDGDALAAKKYIDEDTLAAKDYVDNATLTGKGYVTNAELEAKGYIDEAKLGQLISAIPDSTIDQIIAGTWSADV